MKARSLAAAVEEVGHHDHLCLVYETPEEQFAAAAPYVRNGLERGDRVVYIADDRTVRTVLDALENEGVDVDRAQAAGALALRDKRETYLRDGVFDPDAMVPFLAEATEEARRAGFRGLRVTGEMTWALGEDPGAHRLVEYEAKLNRFFPTQPASAICQYNATRFSPEVIERVLEMHPLVVYGGTVCRNFYYVPPEEALGDAAPGARVRRLLANILERERAEDEIRALNASLESRVAERTRQLAEANRELEAFTSAASHDLRAPLRGILAYAGALEEDAGGELSETTRGHVARIRSEAERLGRLVEDLMGLSRVGAQPLRHETVDLSTVAREVLAELARRDPARRVEARVAPDLETIGDPTLLRLALENLLGNAWKYTSGRPVARIEVGTTSAAGRPAYFVRDNGIGFDAPSAARLFRPFARLPNAAAFDGTGIGLATVQRIVARHGGQAWAEGAVDEGATFYFTL